MIADRESRVHPKSVGVSADRGESHRLLLAVLAAGASRRLGRAKQLVTIDGEALLRRQCRLALDAQIGRVVAILGCRADECAATLNDLPIDSCVNDEWEEGLGASIRHAACEAIAADADGLLLLQVDQYLLAAPDLRSLYAAWKNSRGECAYVATDGKNFGPPVIFPRSCFGKLLRLQGDTGAHRIIAELPTEALCRVEILGAFHDLDLPAQLPVHPPIDARNQRA